MAFASPGAGNAAGSAGEPVRSEDDRGGNNKKRVAANVPILGNPKEYRSSLIVLATILQRWALVSRL